MYKGYHPWESGVGCEIRETLLKTESLQSSTGASYSWELRALTPNWEC